MGRIAYACVRVVLGCWSREEGKKAVKGEEGGWKNGDEGWRGGEFTIQRIRRHRSWGGACHRRRCRVLRCLFRGGCGIVLYTMASERALWLSAGFSALFGFAIVVAIAVVVIVVNRLEQRMFYPFICKTNGSTIPLFRTACHSSSLFFTG